MNQNAYGGSLKRYTDENGNEMVAGYLIRITDNTQRDLHGEYFSTKTNFKLDSHPVVGEPVLFNHGHDAFFGVDAIGKVTKAELRLTPDEDGERGLWIEAHITDVERYVNYIEPLNERMKSEHGRSMGWSSGAFPVSVKISPDGEILEWAVNEASLTPTPADPNNVIYDAKSITLLKELIPTEEAGVDEQHTQQDPATQPTQNRINSKPEGIFKMLTLEQIMTALHQVLEPMFTEAGQMMAEEDDFKGDGAPDEEEVRAAQDTTVRSLATDVKNAVDLTGGDVDLETVISNMVTQKGDTIFKSYLEALVTGTIKRQTERQNMARQAIADARKSAQQAAPAAPLTGGATYQNNGGSTGHSVQVKSTFDDWTAEDMSFFASVNGATNGRFGKGMIDQKFYRELADKGEKAITSGKLSADNEAIKGIRHIKADELDYTTHIGYGAEWVPELWASNIWLRARNENVVAPKFSMIDMPSDPHRMAVEGTDPTVYYVQQTTDESQLDISNSPIPSSKFGTNYVQFSSKKLANRVMISAEMDEDGIRQTVPRLRAQGQQSMIDGIDHVLINGDTSTSGNINLDGGTPTGNERWLAFNGLLQRPLSGNPANAIDHSGAVLTLSAIRTTRFTLPQIYGEKIKDLAIFADYPTYAQIVDLPQFQTLEQYGPQAVILTGEVGRLDGIPVYVSGEMNPADSDGKITSGGNVATRGRLLVVSLPWWLVGYRRNITQSLEFITHADSWMMTMTARLDFKPQYDGVNNDSVTALYNIGV